MRSLRFIISLNRIMDMVRYALSTLTSPLVCVAHLERVDSFCFACNDEIEEKNCKHHICKIITQLNVFLSFICLSSYVNVLQKSQPLDHLLRILCSCSKNKAKHVICLRNNEFWTVAFFTVCNCNMFVLINFQRCVTLISEHSILIDSINL